MYCPEIHHPHKNRPVILRMAGQFYGFTGG